MKFFHQHHRRQTRAFARWTLRGAAVLALAALLVAAVLKVSGR